jgi:hypothetical protein
VSSAAVNNVVTQKNVSMFSEVANDLQDAMLIFGVGRGGKKLVVVVSSRHSA